MSYKSKFEQMNIQPTRNWSDVVKGNISEYDAVEGKLLMKQKAAKYSQAEAELELYLANYFGAGNSATYEIMKLVTSGQVSVDAAYRLAKLYK